MTTPTFRRNITDSSNGYGCFILLLPMMAIVVMALFYAIRATRPLYEDAKDDVFTPSAQGFTGQANALLDELLKVQGNAISTTTVSDINNRYPALTFALPYEESSIALAEDLRLVGIDEEYISEDKKDFYYNSNLPTLLRKQRDNIESKLFRVYTRVHEGRLQIDSIRLSNAMFRVALSKNPWSGSIYARPSCLLDSAQYVYASFGNSVLPMPVLTSKNVLISQNVKTIDIDLEHRCFSYGSMYELCMELNNKFLQLKVDGGLLKLNVIKGYGNGCDRLYVKPEKGLSCYVYQRNTSPEYVSEKQEADVDSVAFDFTDGMQVVVQKGGVKVAEMTLTRSNPLYNLSSLTQMYKGTARYYVDNGTDYFTQQVVHGLASHLNNKRYPHDIYLSLDPILSYELQEDMRIYVEELRSTTRFKHVRGETWDMSVTLMDMNTGEVIASPYVSDINESVGTRLRLTRRNPAFIRRYIGSTFKPLVALAALQSRPGLINLDINGRCTPTENHVTINGNKKRIGNFFGGNTPMWSAGHWGRPCNFTQFLAWSDDVYPVALATLALADSAQAELRLPRKAFTYGKESNHTRFTGEVFSNYRFAKILSALYKVNSYGYQNVDSLKMYNYVWRALDFPDAEKFSLTEISPEDVVMRFDEFEKKENTLFGQYVPWVLGQGNNEWNCIKLAEAYTRMLTKRERWATFLSNDKAKQDANLVEKLNVYNRVSNDTWNQFLEEFKNAQSLEVSGSTVKDMYKVVSSLNNTLSLNDDDKLVLFSKTGTPDSKDYSRNEYRTITPGGRTLDIALYCFALMTNKTYKNIKNNNTDKTNGIVCIVRITRSFYGKPIDNGLWSSDARNFFSAHFEHLEKLYKMTKSYY